MIAGWTTEFAARTQRHLEQVLKNGGVSSRYEIEAAQRTHCLPIYADLSGYILLSSGGELVFYNPESESVGPVPERVWEKVALSAMARRYPDLGGLIPARPALAPTCPACAGTGLLRNDSLYCATCGGIGWIEN